MSVEIKDKGNRVFITNKEEMALAQFTVANNKKDLNFGYSEIMSAVLNKQETAQLIAALQAMHDKMVAE